ncbi:helicase-associated domain-containing protein [Cellulomonas sp. URHD0024]|uniref:helicase-associated domain-containing protein n=1 Tax=Cellulomonas sp. URHD0024 TaxID=1302620 RepID=UPI0004102714|nr:helicase-associated domain-containing protein [Cellulomonas sp. URHD0024]
MSSFIGYLRQRSDDELVALLRSRPDLASPSPATLSSLAVRATSRSSLERALAGSDASVLQVLEAVAALSDGGKVRASDLPAAVGAADEAGVAAVERAIRLALVAALIYPDDDSSTDPAAATPSDPTTGDPAATDPTTGGTTTHPATGATTTDPATGATSNGPASSAAASGSATATAARPAAGRSRRATVTQRSRLPLDPVLVPSPGLAEILGPYPAGLANPGAGNRRAAVAPMDQPTPGEIPGLLDAAPTGARPVLDALLWGPPVGLAPSNNTAAAAAVDWLLRRRLLAPGDARHVVLPRTVALTLRGGRTHPAPATPPTIPPGAPHRPSALVAAESASAGERSVLLVARLIRLWEQNPPSVLRGGGLGVRELRRAAQLLEVDEAEAAFVIELTGAAGFLADDGEDAPSFAPTVAVDDWSARDVPDRWAVLARTWIGTLRTPWLVGTRDDRGGVRAALDPELQRTWAPRLRRSVLDVLAAADAGTVLDAPSVLAALRWRTPRSVPPVAAVAAVLLEAGRLGILGAGALSDAGRALLAESAPLVTTADTPDPADALAAALPRAVDEILLQGDLTGVVPGRPSPELEDLLDRSTHVESRGGALTVRFTPDSVRRALDAGATADGLLAELAAHSRGPLPQPLEYLVRDAARRHGRLRAGSASSYLRADDPSLLAGLAEDNRLATLGLVRLAPTVLASQAPVRELVDALRAHGLAPVVEGPDGQVLHVTASVRRVGRRGAAARRREAPPAREQLSEERLMALVPLLRRAEEERRADESERLPGSLLTAARVFPRDPGSQTDAGRTDAGSQTDAGQTDAGSRTDAGRPTAGSRTDAGATATHPRTGTDSLAHTDEPADAAASAGTARGARAGAGASIEADVTPAPPVGTADPVDALVLLREAAAEKFAVWVELVGSSGVPDRRLLRPLRVEGGRLRAIDPARESELTVAVHRIASVTRDTPAPPPPTGEKDTQDAVPDDARQH